MISAILGVTLLVVTVHQSEATTFGRQPVAAVSPTIEQASAPEDQSTVSDVHDCDRLAAFPYDEHRVAPGIADTRDMNTACAIAACAMAIRDYPAIPRFRFQHGRALRSGGRDMDANRYFLEAAISGYAAAAYYLGSSYFYARGVPRDLVLARNWWQRSATQGNAAAQYAFGFLHANGFGVPADDAQAFDWWRRAAEQGFLLAQNGIGQMYRDGRGVAQDDDLAFHWFREAAEHDHVAAQHNLAAMYESGRGASQDVVRAHMWFSLAAARGKTSAESSRDRLGQSMTPDQIAKSRALVQAWQAR